MVRRDYPRRVGGNNPIRDQICRMPPAPGASRAAVPPATMSPDDGTELQGRRTSALPPRTDSRFARPSGAVMLV